ncbi:hypothetical protein ES707_15315 [subsurface metagenome]
MSLKGWTSSVAKLISRAQPLVMGVYYPRGVYSRVVSCHAILPAVGGLRSTYTAPLAQEVWLLGVDVWTVIEGEGVDKSINFTVRTGFGKADTWEKMLGWEQVLPVFRRENVSMWWTFWNEGHFHWSMNQHYSGPARRFGLYVEGITEAQAHIFASFEISEG